MSNLVLTRKKKDSIIISDGNKQICKVTVTSLGPKQVKLAFEADKSVKIDREEIYIAKNS